MNDHWLLYVSVHDIYCEHKWLLIIIFKNILNIKMKLNYYIYV